MSQADKIYLKGFRKHFTNHEGNFPISREIKLGEYGEMKNGSYIRKGNIKDDFQISFTELPDLDPTYEQFKTGGSIDIKFLAKGDIAPGGVPVAKAQVSLNFQSDNSVFFSSANVRYLQIGNLLEVGTKIMELYKQGTWKKNYVLVSTVLEGDNTIVIVSGSSGAQVTLEAASAEIPSINLADAGANISLKSASSVALQVMSADTIQLGFGLSKIYNRFFNQPIFKSGKAQEGLFVLLDKEVNTDNQEVVFGDVLTAAYNDDSVA